MPRELIREVGCHLLESVAETPSVDGLAEDHVGIAVRGADVATELALLAVLTGSLRVGQRSRQILDDVVAHRRGPRGHVIANLRVSGEAEVVLVGVRVEAALRYAGRGGDCVGIFVEDLHWLTPLSVV